MRLDEVTPLLPAVATPHLNAMLSAWRAGQILDAVVTRVTNVGTATLNVSNISLDVRSELPLTAGDRLVLEVTQAGSRFALRVLAPPAPKDVVTQALRILAPRQNSLAPVLTELAGLAQPATIAPAVTAALASVSPELRALAKNVIEYLHTPAQSATPEGLKQAVKDAGPFFEHRLVTASDDSGEQVFDHDLKAGLLRLAAYLKDALPPPATAPASNKLPPAVLPTAASGARHAHAPPPPVQGAAQLAGRAMLETLAKDVDAALARITMQQLLSLPENDSGTAQWIVELPLRSGEHVDVFHLHVFREKHSRGAQESPVWCVRLSFDLVTLGKVGVLLTLIAGSVSVSIWAQQQATARLFEEHLAALRTELQAAGVAIGRVHCACGDAPFSPDTPLKQKRSGLVDEHA